MNFFNRKRGRAATRLIFILQSSLLVACTSGVGKNERSSNSTFKVDELTAANFRLQAKDPNISLENENVISFKACIEDLAFLNKVIGQDFLITGGERDLRRKTNSDGCLIWDEKFKFNPVGTRGDITVSRTFKALNTQKGVEKVSFAVNPWTGTVVDLRYGVAPQAVPEEQGASALLGRIASSLWRGKGGSAKVDPLPKLHLDVVSGQFQRVTLTADQVLTLTLQPKVRVRNAYGQEETKELTRANVKVIATITELPLYGSGQVAQKAEILATASGAKMLSSGDWSINLKLDHALPDNAVELADGVRHQLHLRVEPADGMPEGLKAEDVAMELGSAPLLSPHFSDLIRYEGTYDDYVAAMARDSRLTLVTTATAPSGSAAAEGGAVTQEGNPIPVSLRSDVENTLRASGVCKEAFSRGPLQFKSWSVTPNRRNVLRESDGMPARIGVSMKVCLDGQVAYTGFPYQVSFLDQKSGEGVVRDLVSDKSACLSWEDSIPFDYFDPQGEHWITRALKVSSKRIPDASQQIPVSIDPWQSAGAGFTWDCSIAQASLDASGKAPSGPPQLRAPKGPARLFLQSMAYSFQGREFEIDKYLTLTMRRKYQVQLTPMVERTNGLTGELVQEPVTSGRFKLRVMLTPDPLQEDMSAARSPMKNPFFLSFEDVVTARAGTIQANIEMPFDFQDFARIGDRDMLYVQLTPIGESTLQPYTGAGPFSPLGSGGSAWLFDSERSAEEIRNDLRGTSAEVAQAIAVGKGETLRTIYKQSPSEIFETGSGLQGLSPAQLEALGIRDSDIDELVQTRKATPELAKKLCKLIRGRAKALGANAPGAQQDTAAPSQFATFRALDWFKKWGKSTSGAASSADCFGDPVKSIAVLPVTHIEEILGKPVFKGGDTEILGTSFSTSRDSGQSRSRGDSVSVNAGLSVSGSVLPGLGGAGKAASTVIGGATSLFGLPSIGWNAGGGWSRSWSSSQSEGSATSVSLSSGKSLWTDKLSFEIDAQTRNCVVVQPANLALAEEYNPAKQTGLHLCSHVSNRQTVSESWYYIVQGFGDGPVLLRDVQVRAERPWSASIRGVAVFNDLRHAMSDQSRQVVLRPEGASADADTTLRAVFEEFHTLHPVFSDGAFPGTVIGK